MSLDHVVLNTCAGWGAGALKKSLAFEPCQEHAAWLREQEAGLLTDHGARRGDEYMYACIYMYVYIHVCVHIYIYICSCMYLWV